MTPHWCSSTLWGPAQMIHFGCLLPQLLIRLWPIPQQVMHTEFGPASQYCSTTLTTPPNRSPDAHNCLASASPLTVMTMAEPCLFPLSCCSRRRFSDINQRGSVFNCMPVEDSTSRFSSSILPSPKYLFKGIPCTLSRCQCSSISTSTTVGSTVFAARMSRFDNRGINKPALAFSVKRADIAPDGAYRTRENRMSDPSLAFCNASFNASINLASDICWPDASRGKRILLPWCSIFAVGLAEWCALILQFLYTTCVQGCSGTCAGLEAATDA